MSDSNNKGGLQPHVLDPQTLPMLDRRRLTIDNPTPGPFLRTSDNMLFDDNATTTSFNVQVCVPVVDELVGNDAGNSTKVQFHPKNKQKQKKNTLYLIFTTICLNRR